MLRDAVASVLGQSYRPIEIIIVDDGSAAAIATAVDALAAEHAEITAIHQPNRGPGLAREAGRQLVRGEFIQHLDSDDLLLPRKFELQVAALRASQDCGVAYGWTRFRHADGRIEPLPWKRTGERIETMFPAMLTSRWWDTPNPLYRASIIAAAGAWTDLRMEEDWEYDCRIAALGVRLAYVPEWVCEVRRHDSNASGQATPEALRDRARAHLLMLGHARAAEMLNDQSEMQFFARDLFHLSRQCGASGLIPEARRLIEAARSISPAGDIRLYELSARILGWRTIGRAVEILGR
jgi:glycosyltransferase involved in cell wall biosynthesis